MHCYTLSTAQDSAQKRTLPHRVASMGIVAVMFRDAKDTTEALVQDKILSFMEGFPGDLYEEPFVDFSTTRNYALQVSVPDE